MNHPHHININDFNYPLPDERIALHPLPERDSSKLLVYRHGEIVDARFRELPQLLPANTRLVFNNTRVLNARILFPRASGKPIEVFCLEPENAADGYHAALMHTQQSVWRCFVGGAAKWKNGPLEKNIATPTGELTFTATLLEKQDGVFLIRFSWQPQEQTFEQVLQVAGHVPLPPYIKRQAEKSDEEKYQTVFAEQSGSVAAPTASLHFSPQLLQQLKSNGVQHSTLTLHVGAGTFKPVSEDKLENHQMHAEWFEVSVDTIEELASPNTIIPVGTTTLRTLESLYWMGVNCAKGKPPGEIDQWEVYREEKKNESLSPQDAIAALLEYLHQNKMPSLFAKTSILIAPGYKFRVAHGLITNFHQPKSTLLLLVAAALGEDWKRVYRHALQNDYRFLSYGDGNLLLFS